MTDNPRHPTTEEPDLDELASAMIDGELSLEEIALIERDSDLAALVTQRAALLREVAAHVAAPVDPPPAEELDRLVRAAMAATDSPVTDSPVTSGPATDGPASAGQAARPAGATVTQFDEARRHRARRPGGSLLPVLGVAAAVLCAFLVLSPLIRSSRDATRNDVSVAADAPEPQDADETATRDGTGAGGAATSEGDLAAEAESGAPASTIAPSADAAPLAPVDLGDLGHFDNSAALRELMLTGALADEASDAFDAGTSALPTTVPRDDATDTTACDATARTADPSLGLLVGTGAAVVGDQPVTVLLYKTQAGDVGLILDAGCTKVIETLDLTS